MHEAELGTKNAGLEVRASVFTQEGLVTLLVFGEIPIINYLQSVNKLTPNIPPNFWSLTHQQAWDPESSLGRGF